MFSYLHTFSKKVEYTRGIRTDKKPMDGISKTINWIKNFVFRKVPSGDVVYCFRRSSQPYEVSSIDCLDLKNDHCTKKIKFSIKDFFSKCDQVRSYLWIWSHLLKKSWIEKFIFCALLNKTYVGLPHSPTELCVSRASDFHHKDPGFSS